jgi:hypothetical protein
MPSATEDEKRQTLDRLHEVVRMRLVIQNYVDRQEHRLEKLQEHDLDVECNCATIEGITARLIERASALRGCDHKILLLTQLASKQAIDRA